MRLRYSREKEDTLNRDGKNQTAQEVVVSGYARLLTTSGSDVDEYE